MHHRNNGIIYRFGWHRKRADEWQPTTNSKIENYKHYRPLKVFMSSILFLLHRKLVDALSKFQKQPFRVVLRKRRSENMKPIYRRTPMPKCEFTLWSGCHTHCDCKYSQNTFSYKHLWVVASEICYYSSRKSQWYEISY